MNEQEQLLIIESINLNPNLNAVQKLDLVQKTLKDCKAKQIGKIVMDQVIKVRKAQKKITEPPKKTRGRPKGVKNKPKTTNQQALINSEKEKNQNGYDAL